MSRRRLSRTVLTLLALLSFAGMSFGAAEQASADPWSISIGYRYRPYHGSYYSNYRFRPRSVPVYHPPSVHYDHVYHHEYSHWTPHRGWHSHGHYDAVPHYVPGHFDRWHGNHVDLNPHFHD